MENLLRWGLANSVPGDEPPRPRSDLDPGIIDAILGKSDAELMKEALAVAVDEKREEDERIQALDDFEMLIEQIDNANNLEKLKMWEPLHSLLVNPSSSEAIQIQTLWILGTAVQNNPSAQHSYLALSPMRALLSFLSPTVRSAKTRSKAVYTLSGLLKHNAAAVAQLSDVGGWPVFCDALQDSDISVRRKVAFLLNALLVPTPASPSDARAQSTVTPHIPAETVTETQGRPAPANVQPPLQLPTSTTALLDAPPATSSSDPEPTSTSTAPTPAAAAAPSPIVHPNSHASMLSDPHSFSTSPLAVRALEEHGLLHTLVASLAAPLPHGPNGDTEGDADYEEKALRALHTYSVGCRRELQDEPRRMLGAWLREQSTREGGGARAVERWNLSETEVEELRTATA